MDLYPFFLECSKQCTDNAEKQVYESLGFGKNDFFVKRDTGIVLITPKGEYPIPQFYSTEEHNKLKDMLWNTNDAYDVMQNNIKEAYRQWINVKKKDKIRLINHYVLHCNEDRCIDKCILYKSMITIAMVIKLLLTEDFTYKNGKITNINKCITKDDFYNLDVDLYFPTSPLKSSLKSTWLKWLKSIHDASAAGSTDNESVCSRY